MLSLLGQPELRLVALTVLFDAHLTIPVIISSPFYLVRVDQSCLPSPLPNFILTHSPVFDTSCSLRDSEGVFRC
jgi:hypothetical protein